MTQFQEQPSSFAVHAEPFEQEMIPDDAGQFLQPGFVTQFSWTQEFLRYMNAVATAAQTEIQADEVNIAAQDDYEHVMILTNHPGQRSWRIYRPDPQNTNRPSFLDIQATPDMALAEIQRRVLMQWPDLLMATEWELVEVSPTISQTSHLPEDMEAFLVRADVDCDADEMVVLIEPQIWRIADASFSSVLCPSVISRTQDPMMVPNLLGWQDHCGRVLCPVWVNGQTRRPTEQIHDGDGTYIIVFHTDEVRLLSSVTAHLTDFPGQFQTVLAHTEMAELPSAFYSRVYARMHPMTGMDFDMVGFHVIQFQLAFTDWYRWLFCYSGMRNIRRETIALFHPTQPPGTPAVFMRLQVGHPLDVPCLYADLIDYDFVTQEDWCSWAI
eukprot:s1392_g6.t1